MNCLHLPAEELGSKEMKGELILAWASFMITWENGIKPSILTKDFWKSVETLTMFMVKGWLIIALVLTIN